MPITIDGTGSISGLNAGGLPDSSIITADLAAGAVTQAKRSEDLTLGTAVTATSGTSIDFTGIPSWVKRITVILSGVSTNGSSGIRFRLGSGSIQTTGYNSRNTLGTTGWNAVSTSTGGFDAFVGASNFMDGSVVFHNPAGNTWIATGLLTTDGPAIVWTGGNVGLSGTLDRVRLTTINGTDTFDAGSINILYE